MFKEIKSIPEKGFLESSNKWFVTSCVIELSKVSILVVNNPLNIWSIVPAKNRTKNLNHQIKDRFFREDYP